jgi:hypothetical protein
MVTLRDASAGSGCRCNGTARGKGLPAALELVAAELRDCHQRLVEGRRSEADRTVCGCHSRCEHECLWEIFAAAVIDVVQGKIDR